MGRYELKLPHMGESVAEATLTNWLKQIGDTINEDDAVVEVATDKVDSEVIAEQGGILIEKRFKDGDIIKVGETIAIIQNDAIQSEPIIQSEPEVVQEPVKEIVSEEAPIQIIEKQIAKAQEVVQKPSLSTSDSTRFYSPLVKNIATAEGISLTELENIAGSGKDGRVTKEDILKYIGNRQKPLAISFSLSFSLFFFKLLAKSH